MIKKSSVSGQALFKMVALLASCVMFFSVVAVHSQSFPSNGCSFNNGRCAYHVNLGHAGTCSNPVSTSGTGGNCPAKCLQVESDLQSTKTELLGALLTVKDQVISSGKNVNETSTRVDGHEKAIADTLLLVQRQSRDMQMLGLKVSGFENEMLKMAADNKRLEEKFNNFLADLNGTKRALETKTAELQRVAKERERLLKQMGINQKLHDQTKAQLQQTINTLTDALSKKGTELNNMASDLQRCYDASKSGPSNCGTPPLVPRREFMTLACNFETSDLCRFVQDTTDDINWSRRKSSYGYYGPKADHTYGTTKGNYLFLESGLAVPSSRRTRKARLLSPLIPPDGQGYCLTFYYFMATADHMVFNVYAKVGNGLGYPIWTKSGAQGSVWNLAKVNITPEYSSTNFTVVFEGQIQSYYYYSSNRKTYRYMAFPSLDDVRLVNRPCSVHDKCPAGTIQMKNNPSSCYKFVSTPLSWYNAVDYCKNVSLDGHLIAVRSREVHQFVLDTVAKDPELRAANNLGWYTSGNDESSESRFVWTNYNSEAINGFTRWTPGQPNNVASNQHCLLMETPPEMTWGDVNCDTLHPFVCEFKL